MTYIKNLLHKIEDLSIGYHLPKFHILCQNSYGIETIMKLIFEQFFTMKKATPRMFSRRIAKVSSNQLRIGQRIVYGVGRKEFDVCNVVRKLLWVWTHLKLKNLDFEVVPNQLKIGQQVAYG